VITTIRIGGTPTVYASRAIETALTAVEGIARLEIRRGVAVIEHDGRATAAALRDAIVTAGCEVVSVDEDRRRLPTSAER
jgi:copper chaperone CopZ